MTEGLSTELFRQSNFFLIICACALRDGVQLCMEVFSLNKLSSARNSSKISVFYYKSVVVV